MSATPQATKRPEGDLAHAAIPSSRWHPFFGQRLSRFVDHHRQIWDVVMAILTVVYVALGFLEDPLRWNAAEVVVWAVSGLFFLEFLARFLDDSLPSLYFRHLSIELAPC